MDGNTGVIVVFVVYMIGYWVGKISGAEEKENEINDTKRKRDT